jgi:hypothetical protein
LTVRLLATLAEMPTKLGDATAGILNSWSPALMMDVARLGK